MSRFPAPPGPQAVPDDRWVEIAQCWCCNTRPTDGPLRVCVVETLVVAKLWSKGSGGAHDLPQNRVAGPLHGALQQPECRERHDRRIRNRTRLPSAVKSRKQFGGKIYKLRQRDQIPLLRHNMIGLPGAESADK